MNREDYQSARKMKLRRSNSVFYIHGIGVDLTKFTLQTEEEKERVRRKLGYAGSDFILFFAAELNRNKHQDLLIQAVKLLKDKGMNVTLLLAGEGDSASDYREQVLRWGLKENVVFLGFRNDIPDLVKMADVARFILQTGRPACKHYGSNGIWIAFGGYGLQGQPGFGNGRGKWVCC